MGPGHDSSHIRAAVPSEQGETKPNEIPLY